MPYHNGGHGPYGRPRERHGALLLWAAFALAALALSLVHTSQLSPLLAVFAIIALARLRQAWGPRLRAAPARTAIEAPGPSALEVLREQYALGEIDLYTFGDAVKLVLAAEGEGYSTSTQYA